MSGFQELVVEGFGEEITEDGDNLDNAHRGELEGLQQKDFGLTGEIKAKMKIMEDGTYVQNLLNGQIMHTIKF